MAATIDSSAIHAIFELPLPDATFPPAVQRYLHEVGKHRPLLFLAFAPKTAGTYFREAAMRVIQGHLIRASHAQGGRDGTPYLPNFLTAYLDQTAPAPVMHVHMQALAGNRHFLQAFGIKPVIMLRNLPDFLASLWDMLDIDPVARAEGLNCLIPANFLEMNRAQKAQFLLEIIAPWYVSYFATWKSYADDASDEVCILRYEEFRRDPGPALHTALQHAGFSTSLSFCELAMQQLWGERQKLRFNKAISGRGRDYFSAEQIAALARTLAFYPQLREWRNVLMGNATAMTPPAEA